MFEPQFEGSEADLKLKAWRLATGNQERLPVIDGEIGGDVYGHSASERGAMRIAARYYADGVVSAYRSPGPITLRDGSTIGDAWVVLSGANK